MSASPLPVLLVIADQQDFYFKEYNDTRISLNNAGVSVVVAARTTNPSTPHPNSGQVQAGVSGVVTPDIALAQVNQSDYSAIAFVGGWGSSMYQYAYNDPNLDGITDNWYWNWPYNGDDNLNDGVIAPTKVVANDLINDFLAADKPVAAICHGVTVLAWARVDGVSPLAGKRVSVPLTVGSPNQHYNGGEFAYPHFSGQHDQVVANGGLANTTSGQYGQPTTAQDDVVVDGRIITAENYDSASHFGVVIAREVWANLPPENHAPVAQDASWKVAENSPVGTLVGMVQATDADAGQTLAYTLVSGNTAGAFALNPATGALTVANPAALDFEAGNAFMLTVRVSDNGDPSLEAMARIEVRLSDIYEPASITNGKLLLMGTSGDDTMYIWSTNATGGVGAWINGVGYGPFALPQSGRVIAQGMEGNDRIFATDLWMPFSGYGGAGHDLMTGGMNHDVLDGGDGVDRLWGGPGNDMMHGGAGDDVLHGREGNNILMGGTGNDWLEGMDGRDLLIGGLGSDSAKGGGGEDLLIGGTTSYDNTPAVLSALMGIWAGAGDANLRMAVLSDANAAIRLRVGDTVHDDGSIDMVCGGLDTDWCFALGNDLTCNDPEDRVTRS